MSLYDVLGVDSTATQSDVARAYRRRATELHPDHNPAPGASEAMVELNAAWFVLNDPVRRAEYDASRRVDGVEPEGDQDIGFEVDAVDLVPAGARLRLGLMFAAILSVVVMIVMFVLAFRGSGDLGPDTGGYGR